MGSAVPLPCPAIGYYCPGTLMDTVNAVPGSLPIAVAEPPDATATGTTSGATGATIGNVVDVVAAVTGAAGMIGAAALFGSGS